jgi:hypothetical protein
MRRLSYPLSDGSCGDEAAGAARTELLRGLPALRHSRSPVFEAVPGYPGDVDPARVSAFEDLVDALTAYQRDVMAIKLAAGADRRRALTVELLHEYGARPAVREAVVVELIGLARDHAGPVETLRYIDGLPELLQTHPPVIEQKQIALARTGDLLNAAAEIENLIRHAGPSADRCGILGGRYKQLMRQSIGPSARSLYLERAIAAYERGMAEDLNDYYPSSNLPRLYRQRGNAGDEQKALDVAAVVVAACRRAMARDPQDEWAVLTLLGAAFDRGDGAEARVLATQIERSGPAGFHLETTVADLETSCALQPPDVRAELIEVLDRMRAMVPEPEGEPQGAGERRTEHVRDHRSERR